MLKEEIENALRLSSKAEDASDVITKAEADQEAKKKAEKEDQDTKKKEEDKEDENDLSASEGCDSKLFDALPTAERRSIKKTLRDARLGKTPGGDQSKAAKNSVTTVLTKDNILKYSGGSFAFEFERLGGQKMKMSWEILVSSVLSSKQDEDLKRLNPFLTPGQISDITNCVSMALLRTVRIAQTGRALVLTGRLTSLIESFLRRLILSTEPKASEEMIRRAFESSSGQKKNLDDALKCVQEILEQRNMLRQDVGRDLADVALGMSDWDLAKAKKVIENHGKELINLASRKCFVNGKALPHLQSSLDEDAMPVPTSLRGRC